MRVRYYLIELGVNYLKENGDEVTPNSMHNYILELQHLLNFNWGYDSQFTKGHIFAGPNDGLFSVLDDRFSEKRAPGLTIKSRNVLSHDDFYNLFVFPELSKNTPAAYQCMTIFNLALIIAMTPTELFKLKVP